MKGVLMLIGFLLLLFGMLSLIFTLIGAQLLFLSWIDALPGAASLVVKLLMIFGGVIIMYLAGSHTLEERDTHSKEKEN